MFGVVHNKGETEKERESLNNDVWHLYYTRHEMLLKLK